jgi:5-formyltetrahydrofolate cyclo-ligase
MFTSILPSADALRQSLRAQRRALAPAQRKDCARQLAHRLAGLKAFAHARHLAAYRAVDGEMDPLPLLERALAAGKRVYLPVLAGHPPKHLRFAPFEPGMAMTPNRFGIPEPAVPAEQWLEPHALDLVLTPLVAFAPDGVRIGMGGGYYDRTFAFRRHPQHLPKPLLVGIAYELQKVEGLCAQPWDVPLDGVVTEAAVYGGDGGRLE